MMFGYCCLQAKSISGGGRKRKVVRTQDGLLEFSTKRKWGEPLINKPDSYLGRHQPVQVQPYKV
jgi:hypothetical protein